MNPHIEPIVGHVHLLRDHAIAAAAAIDAHRRRGHLNESNQRQRAQPLSAVQPLLPLGSTSQA
jgi:hypothetical protein